MRARTALATAAAALVVTGTFAVLPMAGTAHAASPVPKFSHVVEVFLENENATATWEDPAHAPALQTLRKQGAYIANFYGVGHASLDNYQAAFGAVEPTAQGKADCLGMPYGTCVLPPSVPTIADALDGAGLTWKVYSEGEDRAPGGHPCLHAPSRSLPDPYQGPLTNGYATRHNPAPWFDSILTKGSGEAYCRAHAVDLTHLTNDLKSPAALPTFSFVEPDTCHDGHDGSSDGGCLLDPEGPAYPSGVGAINAWLPGFVQQVTTSPAWDDHSLLFITFDEADTADASGCVPCHDGSAGGRIGALAISKMITPGSTSKWQGDHYGFLRTLESSYGLATLKARAETPSAAQKVHDGDPGVTPLTDVWASVQGVATQAAAPAPTAAAPAVNSPPPASGSAPVPQAAAGQLAATGRSEPFGSALALVAAAWVVGRRRRSFH